MKVTSLISGSRLPALVEAEQDRQDLEAFAREHRRDIEDALLEAGALLFRGFAVSDAGDFDKFVTAVSSRKMDYVYGSTPRTLVKNSIYTATEYPPAQEIPLHNEVSYYTEWPEKLALCCITPATEGGQTPLADMRLVNQALGDDLLDELTERKVRYVRHYHPHIDVPWQQVFRTEDRSAVARFCKKNDIRYEWLDGGEILRTEQVCQGTVQHPRSGERFFFNQAHLFHISSLDPDKAASMIEMLGEDRVPRNSFFGDGSEIPASTLDKIRAAFRDNAIDADWQRGDVVLVDNFQAAHGRRTFKGERKILAALMDPRSARAGSQANGEQASRPWWKIW